MMATDELIISKMLTGRIIIHPELNARSIMPRAITVTGLLVTNASNMGSSISNPPPNIFHKLDFPSFMVYFERCPVGGFGQCSYSSSKAGLIGLTKTIALEGAMSGVTANAVTLGVIGTDAFYDLPEKVRDQVVKRVPIKREGSPQDVACLVAFLASDDAGYITGANIILSGGLDLFVI